MDRDAVHLLDVLSSARMIRSYVADTSRQEFLRDTQLQDSVIRRLEIIGEAVGRLSSGFRDDNPDIPWSEIRGLRNWVIHRYDDIDMDVVWETVATDIPRLIAQVEPLVSVDDS